MGVYLAVVGAVIPAVAFVITVAVMTKTARR